MAAGARLYHSPMLRVGLTGGLGSGKSSVARVWAEEGVPVLEADAIGRALMAPGGPVYAAVLDAFGSSVRLASGELDRSALAREAFGRGRIQELNAIVHPAVLAEQEQRMRALAAAGHGLAVIESALIFEVAQGGRPWRERFDKLVLVAAPEHLRAARFGRHAAGPGASAERRAEAAAEARRRMAAQAPDAAKRAECDFVIENDRTLVLLRREALRVLQALRGSAAAGAPAG